MDNTQKAISEALKPLSAKEARETINNGKIYISEANQAFASGIVAAKEADLCEAMERETLSIARDANSISLKALHNSKCANIIAIIATIIAMAAIIIAWLTRN